MSKKGNANLGVKKIKKILNTWYFVNKSGDGESICFSKNDFFFFVDTRPGYVGEYIKAMLPGEI